MWYTPTLEEGDSMCCYHLKKIIAILKITCPSKNLTSSSKIGHKIIFFWLISIFKIASAGKFVIKLNHPLRILLLWSWLLQVSVGILNGFSMTASYIWSLPLTYSHRPSLEVSAPEKDVWEEYCSCMVQLTVRDIKLVLNFSFTFTGFKQER